MNRARFSGGSGHARGRRSDRCETCRKRKVACDGRRPTCQRCEKSHRDCLGYDESVIFVSVEPGAPSRQLHLAGVQDDIVISHLVSKMSIPGGSLSSSTDAPSLRAVLTRPGATSAAYLSGLGFAEALFGRVHKLNHMVDHSVLLYGRALGGLRRDLARVEASRSRAYMNLWTCMLLGMYEAVTAANVSNWLEHSRGMCALMEALGPEAFQSPGAHALFSRYRVFVIIGRIVDRKRCFLEREEWQTIPWSNTERPVAEYLYDVFSEIPGLIEDADADASDWALRHRITSAIQRVEQLRWQWGSTYVKACWETPTDAAKSVCLGAQGRPLFPTYLSFDNVERAVELLYFDAVRLLLYGLSDSAGLAEPSLVPAATVKRYAGPRLNADLLPGQGDRVAHALEICRTVDYFLSGDGDSKGVMVLLFPMRVASRYLAGVPGVAAWLGSVMGRLNSDRGWKIGQDLMK